MYGPGASEDDPVAAEHQIQMEGHIVQLGGVKQMSKFFTRSKHSARIKWQQPMTVSVSLVTS